MDLADPRDLVAWQRELENMAAHLAQEAGERFQAALLGPRPWPAYRHAVADLDAVAAARRVRQQVDVAVTARRVREQVDVVDPGLPVCWTQWWRPQAPVVRWDAAKRNGKRTARTPARSATGPLR